jgi:tetratricopeptide (TPR) repeat protein
LGAGFSAAWAEGIKIIDSIGAENETDENPEVRDFIVFENAWAAYPPAPLPPLGVRIPRPEEGAIAAAAGRAISRYTADELEPKIRDINRQLGLGGASAALYNQLGNLQVRSNRLADAKTAFERAAGMGLADAMANRGNVALVEKDFAAAERWFRQALNAEPDNSTARRGMELVDLQRGN